MQSLPNNNPTFDDAAVAALIAQCNLVPRQNAVWYDIDGHKLVHYLPHLYTSNALSSLVKELEQLLRIFPPQKPTSYKKRSTKYEEWSIHLGSNVPTGVIRLNYHHQLGHSYEPSSPSTDFLADPAYETTSTIDFRKSIIIRDLSDLMSLLFASIDPISWRKYRDTYIQMEEKVTLLKECNTDSKSKRKLIHCFVGFHLVINMLTIIHQDVKELPDGWVGMLVFGNYKNGHLCLSDLGIALPYEAGDIVFIRSWALKYFITAYKGTQRYIIVFSTTKSIFDWLQTLTS